ncbi:MAG: Cellulophaga phage phi10:1 [Bacteroidota bacterium]|jgi:uncharacterized protein with gpF-like domain
MDKLRYRQEVQAYRIVRRNILKIVNAINFNNMSKGTYTALINSNVSESQIKQMYNEIYITLGNPQYKRIKRSIKRTELDFETIIQTWINSNLGYRIVSVHQTLIEGIIAVIAKGYDDNLSVAEITRNLQNKFGWYKAQALRIARTETTTATNYATVIAAENSDFVLEKTWISVQDNRTRRPPKSVYDHLDMNGVKVDMYQPFFTSGENIQYPGDPNAAAGNVINCRCKVVFTVKEDVDGLPIRKTKI